MSDVDWSAVVYDAWVDFNDLTRDGRTTTLRQFLHPAIDTCEQDWPCRTYEAVAGALGGGS